MRAPNEAKRLLAEAALAVMLEDKSKVQANNTRTVEVLNDEKSRRAAKKQRKKDRKPPRRT